LPARIVIIIVLAFYELMIFRKVKTMILYKNVDIYDLISIIEKGILSIEDCGNNNWEEGKRANNPTSVVYLFKPIVPQKKNTFVNYGLALLKVDIESASENELEPYDENKGKYNEYIIERVMPEQIKAIYIPKIFKERILALDKEEKLLPDYPITWCSMRFSEWDKPFNKERLSQFVKTAPISTVQLNFFRGVDEEMHMIDIDENNIVYEI